MLAQFLLESDIDQKAVINKNYNLMFRCYSNVKGCEYFFRKMTKYKEKGNEFNLPEIRKLWISPISEMSMMNRYDLKNFFETSKINGLKYLFLQGNELDFDRFKVGFEKLLKVVENEVFLKRFIIDQNNLKLIIES